MRRLSLIIGGLVAAAVLAPAAAQASPTSHATAGTVAGATRAAPAASMAAPSVRRVERLGGRTAYARSGQRLASGAVRRLLGKANPRAEAATDTYAKGWAVACNDIDCTKWATEVDYAVTWNGTNVWINGYPSCYKKGTSITWCGYGDNGQKIIGIGDNFGTSGQWHLRIYVDGNGSCSMDTTLGVIEGFVCA
jgi:hypothetical protein